MKLLLLCLLLAAAHARAAADLVSDFEEGGLLHASEPPGPWSTAWLPTSANTLAISTDAAHRGFRGLRLLDQNASSDGFGENSVSHDTYVASGDYYLRLWLRVNPASALGTMSLVTLADASDNITMASLDLIYPSGLLATAGLDGAEQGQDLSAGPPLAPGTWHLVELGLQGIGTRSAARTLWVDGVKRSGATDLDLDSTVGALSHVSIGGPWAVDRRFVGFIDFDDVRGTLAPPASRWQLALDEQTLRAGVCTRVDVMLASSQSAAMTPAAEPVTPTLDASGAALHGDPRCETPAAPLMLGPDVPSRAVWVRTGAAAFTLSASSEDYLPVTRTFTPAPGAVARLALGAQELQPGETVHLDGTPSLPSSGATLSHWSWTQLRGPSGALLPPEQAAAFVLTEPGEYVFQLVVEDSAGSRSEPALARVTVMGAAFQPQRSLRGCSLGGTAPLPLLALLWLAGARRRR